MKWEAPLFTETSVTDFVIVCIGAYNIYCEAAEILSFFSGIVYFFQVSLFREIKFIATVKSWVFYKVCQTHMEFYIEGDILCQGLFMEVIIKHSELIEIQIWFIVGFQN